MKTSAKTLWDTLRTSYWFVPMLMVFASVALWIVVYQVDLRIRHQFEEIRWLYTGGPEGARSLLSAIIQSMITVAGVIFSITIVVLTLASQQFGPLLLRNFLRDKGSQTVLGTFVSTFVYCLLALRTVRGGAYDFVPQASVTTGVALGIAGIAVLVYFIHHISVLIQAPYLIDVVYKDLDRSIDRIFPDKLEDRMNAGVKEQQEREAASRFRPGAGPVKSFYRGYVKEINPSSLIKAASEHDLIVRIVRHPGDFVVPGTDLVLVMPKDAVNDKVIAKINDSFIYGAGRTATQDLDFLFSQLVEIAVRALSPGINDPFTAVICIDHLCAALCKLAGRAVPSPYRRDNDGKLRVIALPATFVRMVDAAFGPIRFYGGAHPSVLARLLWSISVAARFVVRDEDREVLIRHANAVRKSVFESIPIEEDRQKIMEKYNQAISELGAA